MTLRYGIKFESFTAIDYFCILRRQVWFKTIMTTAKELFYFSLYSPSDLEKAKVFYRKVFGWEIGGGSLGGHVDNVENTPLGIEPRGTNNTVYFCTLGKFFFVPFH
jgi:hypothetical protein